MTTDLPELWGFESANYKLFWLNPRFLVLTFAVERTTYALHMLQNITNNTCLLFEYLRSYDVQARNILGGVQLRGVQTFTREYNTLHDNRV